MYSHPCPPKYCAFACGKIRYDGLREEWLSEQRTAALNSSTVMFNQEWFDKIAENAKIMKVSFCYDNIISIFSSLHRQSSCIQINNRFISRAQKVSFYFALSDKPNLLFKARNNCFFIARKGVRLTQIKVSHSISIENGINMSITCFLVSSPLSLLCGSISRLSNTKNGTTLT